MRAYDSYGARCNGCSNFAEWCNCDIDDEGNLVGSRVAPGFHEKIPHELVTVKIGEEKDRYKLVEGSQSAHCCFAYTVVDTNKPEALGELLYEQVCECFEKEEAELIVKALNDLKGGG